MASRAFGEQTALAGELRAHGVVALTVDDIATLALTVDGLATLLGAGGDAGAVRARDRGGPPLELAVGSRARRT